MPATKYPPSQLNLPKLKSALYRRATMSTETVRGVLDFSTDQVVAFLQFGNLWAWDLASPGSEPCYRFLTASVNAWTRETAHEALADFEADARRTPDTAEEAIANLLACLPSPVSAANRPWITGHELRQLFNIERTHLLDLVREGVFPQLPGTQFRQGPGGFPLIPRAAVERFLNERIAC